MRRTATTLTLSVLVGAATAVTALPASAATSKKQTAASLLLGVKDLKGFERSGKVVSTKGPGSFRDSCGHTIKLVTKGGTAASSEFERGVDVTPDKSVITGDDLTVTVVLLPTASAATTIYDGFHAADRHCSKVHVTTATSDTTGSVTVAGAPTVKHAKGYVETSFQTGTHFVGDSTPIPVHGAVQTYIYRRGRALTLVSLQRSKVTVDPATQDVLDVTLQVNGATRGTLKRIAHLAVDRLGKQTAA